MNRTLVEPRVTGQPSSMSGGNNSAERDANAGLGRSFLLRLWSSGEPCNCAWQATLEDPHTGQRVGFANLEYRFAYLMELSEGHVRDCP